MSIQSLERLFDQEDILFNLIQMSPSESNSDYKEILLNYLKFCKDEIEPTRSISDVEGLKYDKGVVTTPECLKKLHQEFYSNGWFGIGIDENFEGTPVSMRLVSALSSLSIGCNTGWYLYPALSKACMNVLIKKGTPKIHQEIIPKMMEGKFGGTMCLTESGAGSDVGNISTKAKRLENSKGENLYSITGEKIFISSGQNDLYENIVHLVLAKIDSPNLSKTSGVKDLSLFMVLRNNNNVHCEKIEHKMGIHASATCVLAFNNSVGELIGEIGQGMAHMFLMMNEARLLCSLQGESQAHMAYKKALHYAYERIQFGVSINTHPDVKRMLDTLQASSRGMRALCQYTAGLLDENSERVELFTPIAKAYCTDEGFLCAVNALQIFGGYGYCQEYGMEQYVRDSKIASIYEGTNGIQARDFVFRKILKDKGKNLQDLFKDIKLSLKHVEAEKIDESFLMACEEISSSLKNLENFLGEFCAAASQDKEVQEHLAYFSYPILLCVSHLVISWLLMEQALQANIFIKGAKRSDFSNDYLHSKVVDFQVYVSNYLTRNQGIISSIMLGRRMRTYGIN